MIAAWIVLASLAPGAQAPPAFEVASVRLNTSGSDRASYSVRPGGRFVATNVPLRTLIVYAFGIDPTVQRYVLFGGQENVLSARVDVTAVPRESATSGDVRQMLQALLVERFALRMHIETRTVPVYRLAASRSDAQAPGLRRSTVDCAVHQAAWIAGGDAPPPTDEGGRAMCGQPLEFRGDVVRFQHAGSLRALIFRVQAFADRPIVDATSLTGSFEWDVSFAARPLRNADADAPSIFTAFQDRLGLRLEPGESTLPVHVIDAVSLPSSN